ncbi:MAG: GLPGLI family protein [Lutibacter sp.]
MKKIIILSVLLFTAVIDAQNSKVYVTYKKDLLNYSINNNDVEKQKTMKSIMDELKNSSNSLRYNLLINDHESFFLLEENLVIDTDEQSLRFIVNAGDTGGDFYMNSKTKEIIRSKSLYGETFNIIANIDSMKWELTNERKMIGNFNCYKAVTIKVVENSKGIFNHNVEAWYAPEIPFGFGPVGYGGLPGLIIEIQYQNVRFYASKIELNTKKDTKIVKPTKGKEVTKEEYNEITKKMANDFMKSLKN